MEYSFIKFEGRSKRTEDRITVTKSYSFGFPTKFYNDNMIKDFKYVVIFYDSTQKAIGFHFSNDEGEKNKFMIVHSKDNYGGSIVARSFFRVNNIEPKLVSGRYTWEKKNINNVGEVYIIKLLEHENK